MAHHNTTELQFRSTEAHGHRFTRARSALAIASGSAVGAVPTSRGEEVGANEHARRECPDVKRPMKDVDGKVAFITGGSSGIGLGIAHALTAAGMKVVITYRNKCHLDEAMELLASGGDRVHAINVDVIDRPGMEKAAEETVHVFGKVHVLVNNAGVILPPSVSATSYKDWDWTLNINVNGPFNGVQAFLPRIRSHGEGGQIVTTASVMALFAASDSGAYTVSKYAVIGMMEALRAELACTNIGTSVFCPGLVDSHIAETSLRTHPPDSGFTMASSAIEEDRKIRANRDLAMDPLEAGEIVLRGIRNNDLYIFSHPEYEQIIRDRNDALIASFPQDLHPTAARLAMARSEFDTSIYTIERDRKLCAVAGS